MPELAAWLKANEQAMGIVEEASGRPRFWVPLLPEPGGSGLIMRGMDARTLHIFMQAFSIRAMLKLRPT